MKAKLLNNKHNLFKCGIVIIILVVGLGLYNTIDQILKHTTIDSVSAENFACSDANLQTNDVLILSNDFVKEKGKYVYKISFVNNNDKYDYVINGKDGSVIYKNQSISDVAYVKEKNNTEKKINISIEEAKNIVSNYYEIKNKDNLIYTKAKLDDEKDLVYSIIMNDNEKEYYAEVSASDGNVLSFQIKEKEIKNNNIISKPTSTNTNSVTSSSQTNSNTNTNVTTSNNSNGNNANSSNIIHEKKESPSPAVVTPAPSQPQVTPASQTDINYDYDDDDDDDDYDDDIDQDDNDDDDDDLDDD